MVYAISVQLLPLWSEMRFAGLSFILYVLILVVLLYFRLLTTVHVSLTAQYLELAPLFTVPLMVLYHIYKKNDNLLNVSLLFIFLNVIFLFITNIAHQLMKRVSKQIFGTFLSKSSSITLPRFVPGNICSAIRIIAFHNADPDALNKFMDTLRRTQLRTSVFIEIARFLSIFPNYRNDMLDEIQHFASKSNYNSYTLFLFEKTLKSLSNIRNDKHFSSLNQIYSSYVVHFFLYWNARKQHKFFLAFKEAFTAAHFFMEGRNELRGLLNRFPCEPHLHRVYGELLLNLDGDFEGYKRQKNIGKSLEIGADEIFDPLLHSMAMINPRILQFCHRHNKNYKSSSSDSSSTSLKIRGESNSSFFEKKKHSKQSKQTKQENNNNKNNNKKSKIATKIQKSRRKIPYFNFCNVLLPTVFVVIFLCVAFPNEIKTKEKYNQIFIDLNLVIKSFYSTIGSFFVPYALSESEIMKEINNNNKNNSKNYTVEECQKIFISIPNVVSSFFINSPLLHNLNGIMLVLTYHNLNHQIREVNIVCDILKEMPKRMEDFAYSQITTMVGQKLGFTSSLNTIYDHISKLFYFPEFALLFTIIFVVFFLFFFIISCISLNTILNDKPHAIDFLSSEERMATVIQDLDIRETVWEKLKEFAMKNNKNQKDIDKNLKSSKKINKLLPPTSNNFVIISSDSSVNLSPQFMIESESELTSSELQRNQFLTSSQMFSSNNLNFTDFSENSNLPLSSDANYLTNNASSSTTYNNDNDNNDMTENNSISNNNCEQNNGNDRRISRFNSNLNLGSSYLKKRMSIRVPSSGNSLSSSFTGSVSNAFNTKSLAIRTSPLSINSNEINNNDSINGNSIEIGQKPFEAIDSPKNEPFVKAKNYPNNNNEQEFLPQFPGTYSEFNRNTILEVIVQKQREDRFSFCFILSLILVPWLFTYLFIIIGIYPLITRRNKEREMITNTYMINNHIELTILLLKTAFEQVYNGTTNITAYKLIDDTFKKQDSKISQSYLNDYCYSLETIICTSISAIVNTLISNETSIDNNNNVDFNFINYNYNNNDFNSNVINSNSNFSSKSIRNIILLKKMFFEEEKNVNPINNTFNEFIMKLALPAIVTFAEFSMVDVFYNRIASLKPVNHSNGVCFILQTIVSVIIFNIIGIIHTLLLRRGFNSLFHFPDIFTNQSHNRLNNGKINSSNSNWGKNNELNKKGKIDNKSNNKNIKINKKFPTNVILVTSVTENDEIYSISDNCLEIINKNSSEMICRKFSKSFRKIEDKKNGFQIRENGNKTFISKSIKIGHLTKTALIETTKIEMKTKSFNVIQKLSNFVPSYFAKTYSDDLRKNYQFENNILIFLRMDPKAGQLDRFFTCVDIQVQMYYGIEMIRTNGSIITCICYNQKKIDFGENNINNNRLIEDNNEEEISCSNSEKSDESNNASYNLKNKRNLLKMIQRKNKGLFEVFLFLRDVIKEAENCCKGQMKNYALKSIYVDKIKEINLEVIEGKSEPFVSIYENNEFESKEISVYDVDDQHIGFGANVLHMNNNESAVSSENEKLMMSSKLRKKKSNGKDIYVAPFKTIVFDYLNTI